jgi:hypothetical protein
MLLAVVEDRFGLFLVHEWELGGQQILQTVDNGNAARLRFFPDM